MGLAGKYTVWRMVMTAVAVMGVITLPGCSKVAETEDNFVIVEQENIGADYKLAAVCQEDVLKTKSVRCVYAQLDAQQVRFEVSGKLVENVYVREGDVVKKGQLLAELAGGNNDAQIEQLQYQISRNKLLLEQVDEKESFEISKRWLNYLYNSSKSSGEETALKNGIAELQKNDEYAKEDYEDAILLDEEQLRKLQEAVRQSRVYAAFDGIISNMEKNLEGSTSNREKTIMEVIDNDECVFIAEDISLKPYIREGQELDMQIVRGTGAGYYKMLPYKMETWTDKMSFSISEEEENAAIEVGSAGMLTVILEEKKQVPALPLEAVHSAEDRSYVYIVNEEGMREVKWIETGLVGDTLVEIIGGLEEGEKVVLR